MTMSFTRLLQLGILALPLGFAAAPASAAVGNLAMPQVTGAALLQEAQYGRGPPRRRCWFENRRVRFQDRFGRIVVRNRQVRVCR